MDKVVLKVKKMREDAFLPEKKRETDEGWDLKAVEDMTIPPHTTGKVLTGIALEYPYGYWGQIEGRSGLALKGIYPIGGIIDNGYRGEHIILLRNGTNDNYIVRRCDKIAQLVLRRHISSWIEEVNEINDTDRGEKGFGSSGN